MEEENKKASTEGTTAELRLTWSRFTVFEVAVRAMTQAMLEEGAAYSSKIAS